MLIAVAGLSHASAPVALRERLAYTAETRATALAELRTVCSEAVILDTCNRSELYVVIDDRAAIAGAEEYTIESSGHADVIARRRTSAGHDHATAHYRRAIPRADVIARRRTSAVAISLADEDRHIRQDEPRNNIPRRFVGIPDTESPDPRPFERAAATGARTAGRCSAADALAGFLARFHQVPRAELEPHLYVHLNGAAAAHLCTVAAGADSQVIGEAQVLAQVREAFEFACARETCGPVLSALFRQGLRAGKRARAETRIGHGSLSLGSLAVEHVQNLRGPLGAQKVLLLGAGKMNTLIARSLRAAGAEHLSIASRTLAHATAMAMEFGGDVLPWDAIEGALAEADLVFTATSAPHLILPLGMLAQASAHRSTPLCIVDLALPRDADPLAAGLPNVRLIGLDDLRALAERNLAQRRAELERVQAIVAAEAAEYERWLSTRAVAPTITALHQRAEEIRQSELADNLRRLPDLSPREKRVIESMTASMMGRLLREPTQRLKFHAHEGEGKPYADVLRELFGLDERHAD